jgi:hypothetical protein
MQVEMIYQRRHLAALSPKKPKLFFVKQESCIGVTIEER